MRFHLSTLQMCIPLFKFITGQHETSLSKGILIIISGYKWNLPRVRKPKCDVIRDITAK